MGVPKFFRYTSERYPCLNELVKQYQIPDFDNMYLDMNGIIHNCSHPDDSNPHFRITEQKIFEDIFHYLTILFQIIKPKKLFFMAIDGVAPRAKMNQQRGRRFRSAREADKLEEEAREKGEILPTEKRFDSNCITPGTVFMARLHEQLKYFIKQKITTDPLWSKVKVILSGHETPGEGEHKIMDYIRWARSQPDYDPNTRHCLYGLDADLIMLGMCTHEPHFALLREEVKFGRTTQRATCPEETNFYLLHLSLLREYLEQEFIDIKDNLPFEYDIEKVVDDWVLMGFLVGNDFIPNLPNMHIKNDALPLLYKTYMTVLPTLDGYINESGDLNLARFEVFMQELAKIDKEKFQDTYADLKYFEAKTGRRPTANERREYKPNNDDTFNVNVEDIKANKVDDDLQALINATDDLFLGDIDPEDGYEETSDEEQNMEMEFILHKKDYYMNKLDYSKVTDEVLADQAEGYVRAIQWNLFYYYKGCPSWCWYYPHHYAPYISDIKGFKDMKIEFELGEPFKPFEQLLAVLPAASKQLLPMPFHNLMTDEDSPIVHYYPVNFETDLNGKINEWEAVVLIPFIDEVNLLSAMEPCYQRLTEEELKRNMHGPMLVYNWTPESIGKIQAPEYFPTIPKCHATEQWVWRKELEVPELQLKRGILPNTKRDMLFPGFPTMRHLKYRTSLKKSKVKVFDLMSRNENMIVEIIREEESNKTIREIAKEVLGKVIWVGWPHLTRAKVIAVSNEQWRLYYTESNANNFNKEANNGNLHKQWLSERATVIEHNMNRLGIELGEVNTLIHAVNLKGFKYAVQNNVKMVQEPEWCAVPCAYAEQAVVLDVSAHVVAEAGRFASPQEAYPPGDIVFLLTNGPQYGAMATIVETDCAKSGRIKVCITLRGEPEICPKNFPSPYRNPNYAAASCGISVQMLNRITGTILLIMGERHNRPTENINKINIGLNLKFNKKNQEVAGYTRKCKFTNSWLYSERCIALVKSYAQQFPDLFDNLSQSVGRDVFFESDLFPIDIGKNKGQEVSAWVKSQDHMKAQHRDIGSECLEPEEMKELAADIDKQLPELTAKAIKLNLQVKWSLLYKPELHTGNLQPDPKANYKLYDRVVCVSNTMTVPLGLTGTITAIYPPVAANTVRLSDKLNNDNTYQVMFDSSFPGAMTEDLFQEHRFYRMSSSVLLNLSLGRRLREPATSTSALSAAGSNTRLRPDDGHYSAFADYSLPGEKSFAQKITAETRNNANGTATKRDTSSAASRFPSSTTNRDDSRFNKSPKKRENTTAAFRDTSSLTSTAISLADNVSPEQRASNATDLLRSLLKISDSDMQSKNKRTSKPVTPEQNSNWRVKSEPPVASPQPQRGPSQPTNWRTEIAQASAMPPVNLNQPPPGYNPEWSNNSIKNPPPVPPYPPPYRPPYQVPGPNQMPSSPYFNPHFNRNTKSSNQSFGYSPRQPDRSTFNQGPPPQFTDHSFPKHLPNVAGNVTLGPSWNQPNIQSRYVGRPLQSMVGSPQVPPSNTEKVFNPFVPLQVQTSQRRPLPPGGPLMNPNQPAPSLLQNPQPVLQTVAQPPPEASSRPLRKKKTRVAANLPFHTD